MTEPTPAQVKMLYALNNIGKHIYAGTANPKGAMLGEQGPERVITKARGSYTAGARGHLIRTAAIWASALLLAFTASVTLGVWVGLPRPLISAISAASVGYLTYRGTLNVQNRIDVYKLARRIDADIAGR